MLSTVGLEFAEFVNPMLSWKTVTKGKRSKPAARGFNGGAKQSSKSPKRRRDPSVSESEKLGVAVLGQRFSEKRTEVPPKKRRIFIHSPSPPPQTPSPHREESLSPQPQTPSPHSEDCGQILNQSCASGPWSYADSRSKQHIRASKVADDIVGRVMYENAEDFSGIALLAAAACNAFSDDDIENAKMDNIVKDFPKAEEFYSCTTTMPLKETSSSLQRESIQKDTAVGDNQDSDPISRIDNDDIRTVTRSAPTKVDKFDWDLNTVIVDDEQPCNNLTDLEENVCEDHTCREGHGAELENLVSPETNTEVSMHRAVSTDANEKKSEACNMDKFVSNSNEENRFLDFAGVDSNASNRVVHMNLSLDFSSCPSSCYIPFEGKTVIASSSFNVARNSEDCRTSALQHGKTVSDESIQSLEHAVGFRAFMNIKKAPWEMAQTKDDENFGKAVEVPQNKTLQMEVENSISDSDKVDHVHHSPKCLESCASGGSIGEGNVVIGHTKGEGGQACAADTFEIDSPIELVIPKGKVPISQEVLRSYYPDDPSNLVTISSPSDERQNSHVSEGSGHVIGMESINNRRTGYDSPIEDGELRELGVDSWDLNETEDWEAECVDYGSDDLGADVDGVDYISEKVIVDYQGTRTAEKVSSPLTTPAAENFAKSGSARCSSSSVAVEPSVGMNCEVNDNGVNKGHASGKMDGVDNGVPPVREVGSRASCGPQLSRVEDASSSVAVDTKRTMLIQQNRSHNLGGPYYRAGRDFDSERSIGRERSSFHVRDRNEGDNHWIDSSLRSWDSRNHYRGPDRSVMHNSAPKGGGGGGSGYYDRPFVNRSSRGMYRPPMRRRSPVDSDDYFGGNNSRGYPPAGGINRDRSRYPNGFDRSFREGYRDHPTDNGERVPRFISRRERSFSPNFGRGGRSRSRTRSPPVWHHLQRGRNLVRRRDSRSPDMRPEVRRVRMPFRKPNFGGDNEENLMSPPPPRCRFPKRNNPRWVEDDHAYVEGHFRERRIFRRNERFDSFGPSEILKSDDHFRPMVRPERYPRGGFVRRFRYDGEDRLSEQRGDIIPRSAKHERGSFYNDSPGDQDNEEEASPRRGTRT